MLGDAKTWLAGLVFCIGLLNGFISFFNAVVDVSDYRFSHLVPLVVDYYIGYRNFIFSALNFFVSVPILLQDVFVLYLSVVAIWVAQYSFVKLRDRRHFESDPKGFEAMIRYSSRLGKLGEEEAWRRVKKSLDSKWYNSYLLLKSGALWPIRIWRNLRGLVLGPWPVRRNSLRILLTFSIVIFLYSGAVAFILKFEIIDNMEEHKN